MDEIEALVSHIMGLPESARERVRRLLNDAWPRHPMEERLMASSQTILDALARSAPLTIRGIEGVIAEASFATDILPSHPEISEVPIQGDTAFDFELKYQQWPHNLRVQVKMQRRKNHKPMMATEVLRARNWSPTDFVVEVQRTRGGTGSDGTRTRPYRFGDFDLLAVSLGASMGSWSRFTYTPAAWLIPDPDDPNCVLKYQPVPAGSNAEWTHDFNVAVQRCFSGENRTNAG